MKFILALAAIPAAALALSACSETAEPAPEPVEETPALTAETVTDADCGADKLQEYQGQVLTDAMLADIQEEYPSARAYSEGSPAIGTSFDGTRVNLILSDYRDILDIRCG